MLVVYTARNFSSTLQDDGISDFTFREEFDHSCANLVTHPAMLGSATPPTAAISPSLMATGQPASHEGRGPVEATAAVQSAEHPVPAAAGTEDGALPSSGNQLKLEMKL